jgi:hypothetical protein
LPDCFAQNSEGGKPAPNKPAGEVQLVTRPHKEGEIIVKFKPDAPQSLRDQIWKTSRIKRISHGGEVD